MHDKTLENHDMALRWCCRTFIIGCFGNLMFYGVWCIVWCMVWDTGDCDLRWCDVGDPTRNRAILERAGRRVRAILEFQCRKISATNRKSMYIGWRLSSGKYGRDKESSFGGLGFGITTVIELECIRLLRKFDSKNDSALARSRDMV